MKATFARAGIEVSRQFTRTLRNSFAARELKAGGAIELVGEFMGHMSAVYRALHPNRPVISILRAFSRSGRSDSSREGRLVVQRRQSIFGVLYLRTRAQSLGIKDSARTQRSILELAIMQKVSFNPPMQSLRFLHQSGTYGELATGETTLAFAVHELDDMNFPGGHVAAHSSMQPLGFEVAFVAPRCPALRHNDFH